MHLILDMICSNSYIVSCTVPVDSDVVCGSTCSVQVDQIQISCLCHVTLLLRVQHETQIRYKSTVHFPESVIKTPTRKGKTALITVLYKTRKEANAKHRKSTNTDTDIPKPGNSRA